MTQTIRTSTGRFGVWIEADYGNEKRGKAYKVSWDKISLAEYLELMDFSELSDEEAEGVKDDLRKFSKGFAWQAQSGTEMVICKTEKEARGILSNLLIKEKPRDQAGLS